MENKKRLIDANALKEKLQEHHNFFVDGCGGFRYLTPKDKARVDEITNCIAETVNAPTVDAVEVVHGIWTPVDVIAKKAGYSVRYYHHAECKVNPCRLFECMDDYCPNCGAKMDGGNEDEQRKA